MNKFLPGPESTKIIMVVPKKFQSPLHKKAAKLERHYEAAEGKALTQARIMKSAAAVVRKIENFKLVKEGKKDDTK